MLLSAGVCVVTFDGSAVDVPWRRAAYCTTSYMLTLNPTPEQSGKTTAGVYTAAVMHSRVVQGPAGGGAPGGPCECCF